MTAPKRPHCSAGSARFGRRSQRTLLGCKSGWYWYGHVEKRSAAQVFKAAAGLAMGSLRHRVRKRGEGEWQCCTRIQLGQFADVIWCCSRPPAKMNEAVYNLMGNTAANKALRSYRLLLSAWLGGSGRSRRGSGGVGGRVRRSAHRGDGARFMADRGA